MAEGKQVFVIGAGFTRAFYEGAPLVRDTYDVAGIREQIAGLGLANRVLDAELAMSGSRDKLNIERLLTRASAPLPFDDEKKARHELAILRNAVLSAFREKLGRAKPRDKPAEALYEVAHYCRRRGVDCLTFNYDDFLDQALYEGSQADRKERFPWGPTAGYGFPTQHAIEPGTYHVLPGQRTACLLLKLHGSVNWQVLRGAASPYRITDYAHDSAWFPDLRGHVAGAGELAMQRFASEPFIVPPVLSKGELLAEPLLQLLWKQASKLLTEADRVVFLGYAMADADMAARSLFSEAIGEEKPSDILVVNAVGPPEQKALKERYCTVLGGSDRIDWQFRDARKWCEDLIAADGLDSDGSFSEGAEIQ